MLIVGSRFKGDHERNQAIGWHAEFFAREKRLKSLADYQKQAKPFEQAREDGSRELRSMFRRMMDNQEKRGGAD